MIYHGVRRTAAGALYRLGLALFDLEDPSVCILRGDSWVFGPEADYEIVGDVGYVTFPCGYVVQDDNDTVYFYYGAADTCIGLAISSIREMLTWLDENGESIPTTPRASASQMPLWNPKSPEQEE